MRLKVIATISAVAIVAIAISAYALTSAEQPQPKERGLTILTTFYPLYDFASNVAGNRANVSILVPETVDVHNFEPTPSDIEKVATADILIINGAGLEPWVPRLLAAIDRPSLIVVDTSQGINLLPVPPEFQRQGQTIDPHIWLDPTRARQQVENIATALMGADPGNAAYYRSNADTYEAKLDALDAQILSEVSTTKTKYFVTFHEAFAYFASRYNLTQIPIQGPFQEEPTPSDIQGVVSAIKQYHLRYVGYESLENTAIPQAISGQTNATLILMNPIEGLTPTDLVTGKDYIALMRDDANNITVALNNVE
ncbi:MAG: zinc ABC transporter substrate-binding protein [Candidatus Bathyarchaeia archaeon]|jgi:zinc transport system substrate-binding protein